jgi:peptide/nickel transport system substrate-binding protein
VIATCIFAVVFFLVPGLAFAFAFILLSAFGFAFIRVHLSSSVDSNRFPQRTSLALLILLAPLTLASCSSSAPASSDASTANFLIESMPANLDPRIGTDANSQYLDGLIFSSLLARDSQMNIVPDLAERWETPDPLTYVLHLRRGVQFHDGRPLTSADVKFTFDSILTGQIKTPKRGAFGLVSSIEAPDDATIVFRLHEPYASFLWNLTRPGVGIVPRGSTPAEMSLHPIGSGPFRFVSAVTDEEILLARNPNYFGLRTENRAGLKPAPTTPDTAPSAVQSVRFRIVPDAIVRALELRKGSADVTMNALSPDMVVALAKEKNIQADQQPGTVLAYIAFNFEDKILAHQEVRQALACATDRNTLIEYLFRGQARPASNLLPPNHWAFEPNVPQYNYDPARAEQLLDAAGFHRGPNGVRFHLELKSSTEESARLLGEAIADQWKRVGVVLDLRPLEFATFYSDITRGSFQLYTHRWVGGNNDPDMFEFVFSSKKFPPDGANRGHYKNPALDALLDQERTEMNREKRKALLSQVQKIVATDEPYINLFYLDNVCVHRSRLANITLSPTGDYEFLTSAALR